jgi:hypothetical protein
MRFDPEDNPILVAVGRCRRRRSYPEHPVESPRINFWLQCYRDWIGKFLFFPGSRNPG